MDEDPLLTLPHMDEGLLARLREVLPGAATSLPDLVHTLQQGQHGQQQGGGKPPPGFGGRGGGGAGRGQRGVLVDALVGVLGEGRGKEVVQVRAALASCTV